MKTIMEHYKSQVFISLCLGFQVGVKALSMEPMESTIFNVNAYFSEERIVDFMISMSNSTWLEAQSTCLSRNGSLWGEDRTDLFLYIRILAHQKISWPEGSHIWLNRVRQANSTVWTNDMECGTGRSITEHVHGNNINSTQCLALNMTSPNDVQHLLFAAPCEDQMKFVCILFKGNVSENNGYDLFPAHVLHPRNHTWSLSGISIGNCFQRLFGNFTCFAAEFDADISECSLFCPPLLLLPESIQLQWSTSNKTSVVKTSSNIFMTSDIENSPAGHFPCENTTINTSEPTGVSTVSSSQPVTHFDTATQIAEETTIFTSKMSTSTDFTSESELSTSEMYDTSTKTIIRPTAVISNTNGDKEVSTEEYTTIIPTSSFEQTTLQSAIANIDSIETQSLATNIDEDTPISSTYTTTTAERTVSTTLDSTVSQTTTSINSMVPEHTSIMQSNTWKVHDYNITSTSSLQTDEIIFSTENEIDIPSNSLSTEDSNDFLTDLTSSTVTEDNSNPAITTLYTEIITFESETVSGGISSLPNFENTDGGLPDSITGSLGSISNNEIPTSAETTTHSVTFVNTVADLQESITSATTTTNAITSAVESRASATDSITPRSSTISPQTTSLLFTSKTCTPCVCYNYTVTDKTSEQVLKEILEIKNNLTVKKSTLSSYTRQKISAPDGRWSSAALGSVGVVIIVSASILVILSDIQYVSKAIKVWKKRLDKYRSSRNHVP